VVIAVILARYVHHYSLRVLARLDHLETIWAVNTG
jgi:hypothetical protein